MLICQIDSHCKGVVRLVVSVINLYMCAFFYDQLVCQNKRNQRNTMIHNCK